MKKILFLLFCINLPLMAGDDVLANAIDKLDILTITSYVASVQMTLEQKNAYIIQAAEKKQKTWMAYIFPENKFKPLRAFLLVAGVIGTYGSMFTYIVQFVSLNENRKTYFLPTTAVMATCIGGFVFYAIKDQRDEIALKNNYFTACKIERLIAKIGVS